MMLAGVWMAGTECNLLQPQPILHNASRAGVVRLLIGYLRLFIIFLGADPFGGSFIARPVRCLEG